jgi:hypothetical protein
MGLFTERDEETTNEIIIGKLNRIEAKLDAVIKALHEYDGNDEYGENILNWNVDGAERIPPCVGHDKASWDAEEAERRMDIIGQNGNEGLHYGDVENEFDDYGMRVVDKDKNKDNNTQPKQKQYYKNKRSKRSENKK